MKKFYAAMLLLALVTLLSGYVQAKTEVFKSTYQEQLTNAPPGNMPTINVSYDVSSPAMTWICTLRPGVQHDCSANVTDKVVISADVLSTNYISLSNKKFYLYEDPLRQNVNLNVKYRKPRDGLRQSWQA